MGIRKSIVVSFLHVPYLVAFWGFHSYTCSLLFQFFFGGGGGGVGSIGAPLQLVAV